MAVLLFTKYSQRGDYGTHMVGCLVFGNSCGSKSGPVHHQRRDKNGFRIGHYCTDFLSYNAHKPVELAPLKWRCSVLAKVKKMN